MQPWLSKSVYYAKSAMNGGTYSSNFGGVILLNLVQMYRFLLANRQVKDSIVIGYTRFPKYDILRVSQQVRENNQ